MKASEIQDSINHALNKIIDTRKHTGKVVITLNCSQGSICDYSIEVVQSKSSIFKFNGKEIKKFDI